MLAAYADGQLSLEQAREVEQVLVADPAARAVVDAHRDLRDQLAAHFDPILTAQVPDRLTALLRSKDERGAEIIDFAAAAHKRAKPFVPGRWVRFAGPALAATVVLGLVGVGLRERGSRTDSEFAGVEVASALDNQLVASQPADARVRVLLSFKDRRGAVCRAYAASGQSGIACHEGGGWRIAKHFGGDARSTGDYRQAESANTAAMNAAQDMAPEGALDAASEAEARQQGWRGCCKGQK